MLHGSEERANPTLLNLGMRKSIYVQLHCQPSLCVPSHQAFCSLFSRTCQRHGPEKTNVTQCAPASGSPLCWVHERLVRSSFTLMAKAVAPPRSWWPLGYAVVLPPTSAVTAFACTWRVRTQGELVYRLTGVQANWGSGCSFPKDWWWMGAEGSCVHPVPFCTAVLFSCRSCTITPALSNDVVASSYAREREHTWTHPPPCAHSLHVPLLSHSPTGRSAHVPASRPECTAVTYDIFLSLKRSLTNAEIAKELYISEATVKRHLYTVYQKMGISNQKQLFRKLQII